MIAYYIIYIYFSFCFLFFRLNSHISLKLSHPINKLHYSYFLGFDWRSTPPLPSRCHRFRRWDRFLRVWIFTRFPVPSIEEAPSSLQHPPKFLWSHKEDTVLQLKSQRGHSKYELIMCFATRCCEVFSYGTDRLYHGENRMKLTLV